MEAEARIRADLADAQGAIETEREARRAARLAVDQLVSDAREQAQADVRQRIDQVEADRDDARRALAALEAARADSEARLVSERERAEEAARATAEEYDATRTRLEAERDALQRHISDAETAATALRADLERHVREVGERAAESDAALRERIGSLERERDRLYAEVADAGALRVAVGRLEQELRDAHAALDREHGSRLEATNAWEQEREAWHRERERWTSEVSASIAARETSQRDSDAARHALMALEAEHQRALAARDRIDAELGDLLNGRETLIAERVRLEDELAAARAAREAEREARHAAETSLGELADAQLAMAREREGLDQALHVLRSDYASMVHTLDGERASRERDRTRLAALEQALADAQNRQRALETEVEATAREAEAALRRREIEHAQRLKALEHDLTENAARLTRLAEEAERARAALHAEFTRAAESHHRLIASDVFGYAVTTTAGELVRCNDAFARLFGYADAPDAMTRTAGRTIPGLADRPALASRLAVDGHAERLDACLERADGQPVRIIQSATLLGDATEPDNEVLVEHVLLGVPAGPTAAERRAQRLQAVGTLASEMVPDMEALITTLHERSSDPAASRQELGDLSGHVAALVRQLGAFSRRQARATAQIDLSQAVVRAEPTLLRLVGDYIAFSTDLDETAPVPAHVDDLEHVLTSLVTLGRDLLPAGGSIVVETRPGGDTARGTDIGDLEGPRLIVSASGYGVQIPERAQALEQLIERAGGQLRIHGETGWMVRLDVSFPRCGKHTKNAWSWLD
jgi:hypothetical protein